jgi:hypothetical protein
VVTSRGIEPRSLGLQPSAMTTLARWSLGWSRRRESNPRLRVTRAPCLRQHFVDVVGSGGLEPPRACARGRWAADYPTTRRTSWGERPESNRLERVSQTRGAPLPSPTVGLVAGEGIEPPCAVCRTAVLPLNEPAVGRGGGNRTRISRLMGPPRSPSLPSADVGQQRRAHPGEDNGTRTRTPALTTRRLSLRLCPPQDGPSHFRHAGKCGRLAGIRTPICTV